MESETLPEGIVEVIPEDLILPPPELYPETVPEIVSRKAKNVTINPEDLPIYDEYSQRNIPLRNLREKCRELPLEELSVRMGNSGYRYACDDIYRERELIRGELNRRVLAPRRQSF